MSITRPSLLRALGLALTVGLVGCNARPQAAHVEVSGHADEPVDLQALSRLDATDGVPARQRPAAPVGRSGEWILFANHVHSAYWDGKKPLTELIRLAKKAGLDAMTLTDHNTMQGCESPEFTSEKELVMVKGMEWGAWREKGETVLGHANLLGMTGTESLPTGAPIETMLGLATERNATVIANHPFAKGNAWAQPKPDARIHAVEVWNHWWMLANPIIHNHDALGWWHQALVDGRRLTAVGGTDSHGHWYDQIDHPVNLVFVTARSPEAILAAIRAGHVSVLADTGSARLVLEADQDGDGNYETLSGDVVTARPGLRVRAHVMGGKGKKVVFYGKDGVLKTVKISSAEAYVDVDASPLLGKAGFVRAELRTSPERSWSMTAIANPIYLR